LAASTNGTERARIDSSGRLLVGTSTARSNTYNGSISQAFQVEGTTDSTRGIGVFSSQSNGLGGYLTLALQRSGTIGGNTIVNNADELGFIGFQGSDGTEFVEGARISTFVDGTPGANDMPGRLVFSTTADGAATPTERMRIDSTGRTLIGTTAPILSSASLLQVSTVANAALFRTTNTAADVLGLLNAATTGNNVFVSFGTEAGFTSRGTIDYNRDLGQVRYNITSDQRLKSAIQPAASAVDVLSSIQVRSYKWTETDYTVNYGFIAQELHQVLPDAVKVGDDGEEVQEIWAVDNSKLVPLLTKALQEAIAKIEALETRLSALETA